MELYEKRINYQRAKHRQLEKRRAKNHLVCYDSALGELMIETPEYLTRRPRRNRRTDAIRSLVQETRLSPANFVAPLFVVEGEEVKDSLPSLPGVFQFSVDQLIHEARDLYALGIRAVNLFPIVSQDKKSADGAEALKPGSIIEQAIDELKEDVPDLCVMVDIALDPYTDHGHDGVLSEDRDVDNDATLEILAEMALIAAEAGADMVAPSDMMDGRVAHIRQHLDAHGYSHVGIISYAAKFASSLYGPFRKALKSGVKEGHKKTYQLNPANLREALNECTLDELEGADMLLIKPALTSLDVIAKVREQTSLPLGAYHVSGEYAMVMAAEEKGWCCSQEVFLEQLTAIKRAGADFILTYAAKTVSSRLIF